jgi:tetratricopeptide (TPR) repeat protein
MDDKPPKIKPSINIEGDVKDSNIVVGDGNIITTVKNFVFRDTKQLIISIIAFLLVTGGVSGGYWYSKQPEKMTGNFNISVAQFGEIQADGSIKPSANAEKISSTLFNFLDSEYRASGLGLTVQVAHKNMPLIIEDAQAEELAKKVNADIVIFGNISVQGDQAEFSPRFYVAEQSDTKEMTGQNELAYPIEFDVSNLGSGNEIHTELRTRAEILFNFTKGLIYYSKEDMDAALRSVQTAIGVAEKLPEPFKGEEALYLLAAKIEINQEEMEEAHQLLDMALELNPNYARAYLARGNIFYTQAIKTNFDADLLDKAQVEYTKAYEAPDQPEGAYIPVKAHTTLGNVLVVKAQQTNDPELFSHAIEHYLYVTEEYERTKDPFLRSYAEVAYFGLGAAYERQGRTDDAIEMYERAYDLTKSEEFKTRIKDQIKAAQGK